MKGGEFIKKVQKIGKARGVKVWFEEGRGKGSHGTLWYGGNFTVVKDRKKELKPGTLRAMIRQLGLNPDNLR